MIECGRSSLPAGPLQHSVRPAYPGRQPGHYLRCLRRGPTLKALGLDEPSADLRLGRTRLLPRTGPGRRGPLYSRRGRDRHRDPRCEWLNRLARRPRRGSTGRLCPHPACAWPAVRVCCLLPESVPGQNPRRPEAQRVAGPPARQRQAARFPPRRRIWWTTDWPSLPACGRLKLVIARLLLALRRGLPLRRAWLRIRGPVRATPTDPSRSPARGGALPTRRGPLLVQRRRHCETLLRTSRRIGP